MRENKNMAMILEQSTQLNTNNNNNIIYLLCLDVQLDLKWTFPNCEPANAVYKSCEQTTYLFGIYLVTHENLMF